MLIQNSRVNNPSREKVIIALDYPDAASALALVEQLGDRPGFYKIGLQLFTAAGPQIVREVRAMGGRVFLDLKFYDIPNTVRGAVQSSAALGVSMLTIHAGGGGEMIRAACGAAAEFGEAAPLVLGVTVLTSSNQETLASTGVGGTVAAQVDRLLHLGLENGLKGFVASPLEAGLIRETAGTEIAVVTPGVRPAGSDPGDQKRFLTPRQAVDAGASHLVIGRPVTAAADPMAALEAIFSELEA